MGYFEDLFAESELEKELKEKRKVLEDSFYDSPGYKAYDEAMSQINEQIMLESKKKWKKVKEKRCKAKIEKPSINLFAEKEKPTINEDKIDNILKLIDSLTKEEKELYVRKYNRKYEYKSLDDYENPVTTIQDIKDLQRLLAQSLINFVYDRNLSDIDEVSFYFDGVQDSVKAMDWSPASDSSISVIGLQEEKDNGMTARRLIGKYY